MPRKLVKRIPRAVAVGLLSTLVLGAALGAAYAAGEPALPETFGIPALHEGDRGLYTVSGWIALNGTMFGEPVDEQIDVGGEEMGFEWAPATTSITRDGTRRWVHPMQVYWSDSEGGGAGAAELHFDATSGEIVGRRSTGNTSTTFTLANGGGVTSTSHEITEDTIYWSFDAHPPFCGYRSGLQGQLLETRAPLIVEGPCIVGENATDSREFIAAGVDKVRGVDAVRYEANSETDHVRLWFAREASVPVRVSFSFLIQQGGLRLEGEVIIDLLGFEAGNRAYRPITSNPGPNAPPIQMAPATFLGPDASGFEMEFSLQDAWDAAYRQNAEVGDYMARHPSAYVAYASYTTKNDHNETTPYWSMIIADGGNETMQIVAFAPTHPIVHDAYALLGHPIVFALGGKAYAFTGDMMADWFPAREWLPHQLPTVASMARAWAAFDPEFEDASAVNSLGFMMWCGDFNCSLTSPIKGDFFVGREGSPQPEFNPMALILGGQNEARENYTALSVNELGVITGYEETRARAAQRNDGLLGASERPAPSAPKPREAPLDAVSPWWTWPSPEAAAGAGLLGILVGVVYWLWPTIKSGPVFGLFSRLRENQVLKHPARAQILQELEAEPGLHHNELRRRLGAGNGVVEHHLRILVANDLVIRRKEAGYVCFFPARGIDRRDVAALPWLKSDGVRKVLASVAAQPGQSGKEIAAAARLDPATVNYHLKRLREAGLVEARREGRRLAVHPTAHGQKMAGAA